MSDRYQGDKVVLVRIKPDVGLFYIIVDREMRRPIGFLGLSADSQTVKEVSGLFVEPNYRRKGFTVDVVNTLNKNFDLKVTTHPKNTPLRKLLVKEGFKEWIGYEKERVKELLETKK